MKDSLRTASFNKFKSNPSSYLAVGVMCGLFLIIATVLAFIDPLLLIFAVPLIALPFLFASHVACYYLQINQQINPSAFIRYFTGFFRAQFRGSFRGLISFLKSLAFYFGMVFVGGIVMFLIFKGQFGDTFTNSFNTLIYQYIYNPEATSEDIIQILNANDAMTMPLFGASRPFSYLEIVIFETTFPMDEHSSSIESPFIIRAFLSLAEKMDRSVMMHL